MGSKLNLDQTQIDRARVSAKNIAEDIQGFIDQHTTVTVERAVARLYGIDGVDDIDTPLPNVIIDVIKDGGGLPQGLSYWLGNAIANTGLSAQEIAEQVSRDELDIMKLPQVSIEKIQEAVQPLAVEMTERIRQNRKRT